MFFSQVREFVHLTDYTYTCAEVVDMEWRILMTLNFRLSLPTAVVFSGRYMRIAELADGVKTSRKVQR